MRRGEDGWEEREVRDERRVDEDGDPCLQIAVQHHHAGNPIERAAEVQDAGEETERERAAQRRSLEGDEKRGKRNPAKRRMAELRKAEREENSRRGG